MQTVGGPDQEVSLEQKLFQELGHLSHSCYILAKNLASFCLCPENLNEVEFKSNKVNCLEGKLGLMFGRFKTSFCTSQLGLKLTMLPRTTLSFCLHLLRARTHLLVYVSGDPRQGVVHANELHSQLWQRTFQGRFYPEWDSHPECGQRSAAN